MGIQTWGIAQKQTGADRLTMAGTIAANAHGRGLQMKPFVSDVESFVLVDATGTARTREPNGEPRVISVGARRIRPIWNRYFRAIAPRAEKEGRAGSGNSDSGRPDCRL